MRQLWAPWRMAYIGDDHPRGGCVLCAIIDGTADESSHIVERAGTTITVLNRYPYNSGHVLVVPLRHAPDIVSLDGAEAAALVTGAQRAVAALQSAFSPDGFNIGINQGAVAGAGIADHVHLHVVPRWLGDTNFMPVLTDVKVLPEHLDATASRLREALRQQPGS